MKIIHLARSSDSSAQQYRRNTRSACDTLRSGLGSHTVFCRVQHICQQAKCSYGASWWRSNFCCLLVCVEAVLCRRVITLQTLLSVWSVTSRTALSVKASPPVSRVKNEVPCFSSWAPPKDLQRLGGAQTTLEHLPRCLLLNFSRGGGGLHSATDSLWCWTARWVSDDFETPPEDASGLM